MKTKIKRTKIKKSMKRRGGTLEDGAINKPFRKLSFNLEDIKNKLGALAAFMESTIEPLQNTQLETANNFLNVHFKTDKQIPYTETYTNTSIFMLDPLLNDIDDIFAFIYFFYLSMAYKMLNPGENITLYMCIDDIDTSKGGFVAHDKFEKINSYTDAIVDYCEQVEGGITVVKLDMDLPTSKEPASLFIHRGYTLQGITNVFERFAIKNVIMNGNVNIHIKDKPININLQSDYDNSAIPSNLKQGLKFYKKKNKQDPDVEVLTLDKRVEQFQTYKYLWENAYMYVLPLTRAERLISLYFDDSIVGDISHIRPREIEEPFVRKPEWGSDVIVKIPVKIDFNNDMSSPIKLPITEINLKDKKYPHFPYHDYEGDLKSRVDYTTPPDFLSYLNINFKLMQSSFNNIKECLNNKNVTCNASIYVDGKLITGTTVPFGELCFPNRKPVKTDDKPGTGNNPTYILNDGTFTCEENGSFMIDALTVMATLGESTNSILSIHLVNTPESKTFISKEI